MAHAPAISSLVHRLAERLQDRGPLYDPYVIEKKITQTRSLHLTVIWDAWTHLPPDDRSAVIMDAHREACPSSGLTIRIALGLTVEEAYGLGFFEYAIVPTVRSTDGVTLSEVKDAIKSVNVGFPFKTQTGIELRFCDREDAENAYRELSSKFSGKPVFAIIEESPSSSSSSSSSGW